MNAVKNHRKSKPFPKQSKFFSLRNLVIWAFIFLFAYFGLKNSTSLFTGLRGMQNTPVELIYHNVDDMPDSIVLKLDAVVVLGGGAPKSVANPPFYSKVRCDDAAKIVKKRRQLGIKTNSIAQKSTDLPILCLSAGTAHVPQLIAKDGLPVWESTSSAAYLQGEHKLSNLFVETTSYDTIGNAFFARTSHTDINEWRTLLIITSEFHMARSKAIFDWIFLDIEPRNGYEMFYLASKNEGLSDEALRVRSIKENDSLESVQQLCQGYRTMKDLYTFLTTDHSLYTANKLVERAMAEPNNISKQLIARSYGGDTR